MFYNNWSIPAELAQFLVKQGAARTEAITILVPYTSQLFFIRMLLRAMDGVYNVTCSTVDQYQVGILPPGACLYRYL